MSIPDSVVEYKPRITSFLPLLNKERSVPGVEIEAQGGLFKTRRVGCESRGGGARGVVNEFSAASRLRLIDKVSRLEDSSSAYFLTVTYHSSWPSPKKAKEHLRSLLKRIERWAGVPWGALWRLEPQKRGAPHFHVILWPKENIDGDVLPMTYCDKQYGELRMRDFLPVGKGGVKLYMYQCFRRMWAGVIDGCLDDLDRERVRRGDSLTNMQVLYGRRHVMCYVAKYVAKVKPGGRPSSGKGPTCGKGPDGGRDGQGESCAEFVLDNNTYLSATGESVGRWWGICHPECVPFAERTVFLTAMGGWYWRVRRVAARFYPGVMSSWKKGCGFPCPGYRVFTESPEHFMVWALQLIPEELSVCLLT